MKNSLKIIAASLALFAGQVSAAPINVGGVVWDPDSFFDFTSGDQMVETIGNNVGDVVSGFGRITSLNGDLAATFCPGCELTYVFGGFTITSTTGGFTFSGGTLNVYVDNSPNFSLLSRASAIDGSLWLSLAGHTSFSFDTGRLGTLHSDPTPTLIGVEGDGGGYFDVTGGMAAGNFDTNTRALSAGVDGRTIEFADFSFTSSFQLLPNGSFTDGGVTYGLFGTNDLQGDSIPEPGSMALIGAGLIGLGALRRRKAK